MNCGRIAGGKAFQMAKGKIQKANGTSKQDSRGKTNQKAKSKSENPKPNPNMALRTGDC
jgi:hypothetical protein